MTQQRPAATMHSSGSGWSVSGLQPASACLARRYGLSSIELCWRMELGPGAGPWPLPSLCSRMPGWVPPPLLQCSGVHAHLAPTLCSQESYGPSAAWRWVSQ